MMPLSNNAAFNVVARVTAFVFCALSALHSPLCPRNKWGLLLRGSYGGAAVLA